MQKARWIVFLAVACVFVMAIPAFSQLAAGSWPKFQHDAYNSGRSPAIKIAKPVVTWTKTLSFVPARTGMVLDAQDNIYVLPTDNAKLIKVDGSSGDTLWTTNAPTMSSTAADNYRVRNGPTLFDNGTDKWVLIGPGRYANSTTGRVFAIDPATGNQVWTTVSIFYSSSATGCYTSPAVGADGTIYSHLQLYTYDKQAPTFALNPGTAAGGADSGTEKWRFNSWNGVDQGVGGFLGTYAVKTVEGRNRVFTSSGSFWEELFTDHYQVMAIDDMGDHAELVWGNHSQYSAAPPSISNDGNTIYVACSDTFWYDNTWASKHPTTAQLEAYDANTGTAKWTVVTGSLHVCPPAIANDGTVYVVSTKYYDTMRSQCGRVCAVRDDGDHGTIKWTLDLPDDGWSECSNVAVISTNPSVIYVGASGGKDQVGVRFYAIADMGDHPKIIWTYQGKSDPTPSGTTLRYNSLVVADNGDLYASFGKSLLKFSAGDGFDEDNPNGISGYIKDSAGNPIANAWVAASTSDNPLLYSSDRIQTRTGVDGYYQLGVKAAGTYNVAATAPDYNGSAAVPLTLAATADVVKQDFTLNLAKYNWAVGSIATCSNANSSYPAGYAADGNLTSQFKSTAAASALVIDLGTEKMIGEAAIYSEYDYSTSYTINYSSNGTDWTTASTVSQTAGGFPLDWYPAASDTNLWKTGYNVVTFTPATARYWQINSTAGRTSDISFWEVELRDATKAGPTTLYTNIGDLNDADNEVPVSLGSVVVTATDGGVPADSIFVESADRTAGIRVTASDVSGFMFGDRISIVGKVYTDANNGKYISAASLTKLSSDAPLEALGMNNKAAAEDTAQGLFIKTWGKVSVVDTDSFTISDGSATAIKVLCGDVTKPIIGDNVRVRGVAGKDASGPVLYMRGESADWTTADAAYQALPFIGTYKYPHKYLVLGPYTGEQPSSTYWSDWLFAEYFPEYDFISVATGGAATEAGISQPKAGDILGGKTWTKAYAADGKLDINSVFGGTTANAVAYVYLNVWSEVDNPTVELTTGSDDWLRVYVNGSVFRSVAFDSTDAEHTDLSGGRGCNYGDDYSATETVPLHKGSNDILFKIVNGSGGFGVTCQFVPAGYSTGTYGYGGYPAYTATGLGYITSAAE